MLAVLVLALVLTTEVANADFTFGEPTNLGAPVNSPGAEMGPTISVDGLELYFEFSPPMLNTWNLWIATRPTQQDDWEEPVLLGPEINSSSEDGIPQISPDGLELYFYSKRPSGHGGCDIWVTRRSTLSDPWGPAVNLGPPVNSGAHELSATITADGLEFVFARTYSGASGADLFSTTRATRDDPWATPVKLGPTINSSASESSPSISADGLILFFSSHPNGPYPPGGCGGTDIWVAKRPTRNDPWGPPWNPGPPLNTAYWENCPSILGDGRWLYFSDFMRSSLGQSPKPGGHGGRDIWQAPIIPIVDLNGDGIVDAADMCIMVDHWGTDEPLCDIGPMPWGNGIVDVQDLIVLADHLFEDVNDPTLVAHWPLDETEGDIASDIANDNDGTVYGDPAWQPEGGMVDGALELDGINDYVSTPFVLNPADGKFSVFVWIKGGAPGQAVLSQVGGANWLFTDSLEGNLMTELKVKGTGRGATILPSQAVITDGNWHRIGLVWDVSYRKLYVDDVAVAEDTQTNLEASENGLYIGAGTAMEPGSFWSGLIDDVRVYNRAVTP